MEFFIADDFGDKENKLCNWKGIASSNEMLSLTVAQLFPQMTLYRPEVLTHLIKQGKPCLHADFSRQWKWGKCFFPQNSSYILFMAYIII